MFRLAELLIFVAIIGVLVAISIPIFTSQLEKSREAVDAANIRAAYAEVSANAITADTNTTVDSKEVVAKQTQAKWQSQGDAEQIEIGGQKVDAKVNGAKWTISATKGTDGTYTVTIA